MEAYLTWLLEENHEAINPRQINLIAVLLNEFCQIVSALLKSQHSLQSMENIKFMKSIFDQASGYRESIVEDWVIENDIWREALEEIQEFLIKVNQELRREPGNRQALTNENTRINHPQ